MNRKRLCQQYHTTPERFQLYQGVPHGTVLGPLLFIIHVKDMQQNLALNCQILQNADGTMLSTTNEDFNPARSDHTKNLTDISEYFRRHKMNLNADKTEFIAP